MTKALPQGLELTHDPHGLDTVRVSMGFYEALALLRSIISHLYLSSGDPIVFMLTGWLDECQGEKEHRERKANRLRLLEAVAEAARAEALDWRDQMGYRGRTLAELAEALPTSYNRWAVLSALIALEADDE